MDEKQVTTNEIMDFLQDHMVMKEEFKSEITQVRSEIKALDVKLNKTKLELIDAMDEKNAALRGDIIVLMRGEDRKLTSLIEIMKRKNLLDANEAQALLALPPFPQLSL